MAKKDSTTTAAKRRGEAAEAATSTVVEPVDPNPAVDAQLEAIGAAPEDKPPEAAAAPQDTAPAAGEQPAIDVTTPPEDASPPPPVPPVPLAQQGRPPVDDVLLNPFTRELAPEPKPSKKKQQQERTDSRESINRTTPSTRRFGAMGNKLPGAEHVIVRKRTEKGQLAYIGEFHSGDLAQSQNIESFLSRYIQPKFGAGEYWICGVDAAGREFDAGYVNLLQAAGDPLTDPGAPASATGASAFTLMQQILDRQAAQRDAEIRALSNKRDVDPINLMRQMHELQKEMAPPPPMPPLKPSEKGSTTTDTVLAGMMQMMTTVLAQAMQPSPLLVAMLQKLTEDKAPSASTDPTQQLVLLSEVLKNLNSGRGNDLSSDMLQMLMKERMAPSDVLHLVQEVKGERGTDDLKKSMENLGFLLNAVQQLRAHTEPGGSGFWDAINSIFSNPGLAGAIGSKVNTVIQQQRTGALPPQQQQQQPPPGPGRPAVLPPGAATQPPPARDPLALKARELIARKQRVEELELAERERRLGIGAATVEEQPPAAAPVQDVTPAPAAAAPAAVPAPDPSIPATPGQQITLPTRITDFLNGYVEANDDAGLVQTTIELIFGLAEDEQWRPYSEVILSFIVQNDRAKFMHYMSSLFTALRQTNLLDDALAANITNALQQHFDTIVAEVINRIEALQQAEGIETPGEEMPADGEELPDEEGEDPNDLLHLNQE